MCIHLYVNTYISVYIELKKINFTPKLDKSVRVHMLEKVRKKFPLLKNMYVNSIF